MFSVIFGLSMDYEVLLLSRIQEAYRRTGDNTASVAEGLAKTAGVITGAALIMVSVFAAFALADIITIKSIGVGMAIAVLLDATIIRVLLVPATMRLLGDWNWWAPGPLKRFADRLGFDHVEDEPDEPDAPAGGRAATRPRGRDRMTDDEHAAGAPRRGRGAGTGFGSTGLASGFETRTWTWGDEDVRRGLPWIGVFLVVFGGILLLGTAVPERPHPRLGAHDRARRRPPRVVGDRARLGPLSGPAHHRLQPARAAGRPRPAAGRRRVRDVPLRGRPARRRGDALDGPPHLGLAAGRRRDPRARRRLRDRRRACGRASRASASCSGRSS